MSLLNDFFSLFFPRVCQACGATLFKTEEVICTFCNYHLPRTNFHLEQDNWVSRTFWGRTDVFSATALFYFNKGGKVQHLIHRLKYNGEKEIGIFLGKQYGYDLQKSPFFNSVKVVLPVPLHSKKEKKRGYNQSEMFAIGLAQTMQIELVKNNLIKTMATESQTRKSRFKRWENVKEIFVVKDAEKLEGKHVLLVDDVITTGATIESCANTLLKVPGIRVSVAAIAFTQH
jgi:ComF family protein